LRLFNFNNMTEWFLRRFNKLLVADLYAIMRLRQEVFIVEQNCPYLDADGKDLHCHHLMGFIEDELAAYARIVPPGISYKEASIGRVVTSAKHRRQQLGKQLMQQAIDETQQLYGHVPIRIGAQQYLKKFYEGFGFRDLNKPYMEDGIPHIIMLRKK
jgi:ElaA protein